MAARKFCSVCCPYGMCTMTFKSAMYCSLRLAPTMINYLTSILPYPGFHYHCLALIDKWRPEHNWGESLWSNHTDVSSSICSGFPYVYTTHAETGLYLPTCWNSRCCLYRFPLFLFLMKLNKGYINVRSRPHQKQDYIWLTIWAKIFSTGKLLPFYNHSHKVCMINHMHVGSPHTCACVC